MSTGTVLSVFAGAIIILAGIAYLVVGASILPENGMSGHGWFALILGSVVSLLVGGALAAVLIISRRRGFDEAAYEVYKELEDR